MARKRRSRLRAQAEDDAREAHGRQVRVADSSGGGAVGGAAGAVDYERAIGERDTRLGPSARRSALAARPPSRQTLPPRPPAPPAPRSESDRVDFALRLAGVRNVKTARAVLDDYEGDVEALRAGEPWLFSQARRHFSTDFA